MEKQKIIAVMSYDELASNPRKEWDQAGMLRIVPGRNMDWANRNGNKDMGDKEIQEYNIDTLLDAASYLSIGTDTALPGIFDEWMEEKGWVDEWDPSSEAAKRYEKCKERNFNLHTWNACALTDEMFQIWNMNTEKYEGITLADAQQLYIDEVKASLEDFIWVEIYAQHETFSPDNKANGMDFGNAIGFHMVHKNDESVKGMTEEAILKLLVTEINMHAAWLRGDVYIAWVDEDHPMHPPQCVGNGSTDVMTFYEDACDAEKSALKYFDNYDAEVVWKNSDSATFEYRTNDEPNVIRYGEDNTIVCDYKEDEVK